MSESETVTLDPRADRIRATFCAEHPRLRPADVTITPLDGQSFRLDVEGATFRATLSGADSVMLTLVDPADPATDLAPGTLRRLVAAPAPPPVHDPHHFDVNAERRHAIGLLDRLRHLGEQMRLSVRQVATSSSDEMARLSSLVPADAIDSAYLPLAHGLTLKNMCREAVVMVVLLQDLRRLLAEAETYRRTAEPRLRDAVVALAVARRGEGSLAAVPSLVSLGEVVGDRHSQMEVNLDDLTDRLDVLRRAVEEISPLVARFEEAARLHTAAMLETARRAAVATATATLARLRAQAVALRVETEAETLAREAATRLGVSAPGINWPDDPFTPPTLT